MNSPLVLGVNIIACDERPARREEALPASPGAGGAVSAGGERRLVLLEQAERRAATAGGTSPGILCGGGGGLEIPIRKEGNIRGFTCVTEPHAESGMCGGSGTAGAGQQRGGRTPPSQRGSRAASERVWLLQHLLPPPSPPSSLLRHRRHHHQPRHYYRPVPALTASQTAVRAHSRLVAILLNADSVPIS